jgi:7-cyano-7-deazaguanine synthase
MKALVVLSGGQDSTICLHWAIREWGRDQVAAVTFDYQQRHQREIDAADIIADMAGVKDHEIIKLGPILKGSSPLTNPAEALELYGNYQEMDSIIGDRVEKTFVPMRNALFLTVAANRAEVMGADKIITGVCQQDNANYPDCRAEFIVAMEQMIGAALGDEQMHIITPLMFLTKAQSIRLAMELPGCMEALAYSHTAYDGGYPPTSKDHASTLRAQGFLEAGVADPLVIRAWREGLMELPDSSNYAGIDPLGRSELRRSDL